MSRSRFVEAPGARTRWSGLIFSYLRHSYRISKAGTTDRFSGRWERFSWFGILPVRSDGELADGPSESFNVENLIATMEALLIEGLEPPQNRKRGDGFSAVEFIQVVDPEIERRQQQELMDKLKSKL